MEELINNIDSIQIELETTINKMQQNLKDLRTKAATIQAQQKQGQEQTDNRFTLCTLKEYHRKISPNNIQKSHTREL